MDKFEEAGEKIRAKIQTERKLGSSECTVVAEHIENILDDDGTVELMEASLDELIIVCKHWQEFLKDMPREE